jgi:glycerol-3-phosphate dehydrogenase
VSGLWQDSWRDALPAHMEREWYIVVIGGGITGAGILLEAARRGLKAVLVEQRDFAWGTSSRSSKLVHGGLRYLKQGQFALTRESVRERQNLLQTAYGLVEPQGFAFGDYVGRKPGRRVFLIGLAIYDWMARSRGGQRGGQRGRHYFKRDEFLMLAPNVATEGLQGGMCYQDAKTDDARLVLRVLQEAQQHGALAINYMAVKKLLRSDQQTSAAQSGQVCGVLVDDAISGTQHALRARLVINATGAWADGLRAQVDAKPKLRPLRGSHLMLPAWRLPLAQAISLMHPQDGRPVFAYPWEGAIVVGTTDLDHRSNMQIEPAITRAEADYLMAALQAQFPQLGLSEKDVIATYAGVRSVEDSGQADPSKEGREHALWLEQGLLTVTGGKLTTFRMIALDALRQAAPLLPGWSDSLQPLPIFDVSPELRCKRLSRTQKTRLTGRYGAQAQALVDCAQEGELETIPGTETLWVQLRWAARMEAVAHLDDLLLRRTRLGLLLRCGGSDVIARVRAMCQPELGWLDARWDREQADYLALWQAHYSLPKDRLPSDMPAAASGNEHV